MITNHKFRNLCGFDCESCRKDPKNMCSSYGDSDDDEFRQCHKIRAEHAEIEEWSQQIDVMHPHPVGGV